MIGPLRSRQRFTQLKNYARNKLRVLVQRGPLKNGRVKETLAEVGDIESGQDISGQFHLIKLLPDP